MNLRPTYLILFAGLGTTVGVAGCAPDPLVGTWVESNGNLATVDGTAAPLVYTFSADHTLAVSATAHHGPNESTLAGCTAVATADGLEWSGDASNLFLDVSHATPTSVTRTGCANASDDETNLPTTGIAPQRSFNASYAIQGDALTLFDGPNHIGIGITLTRD